MDIEMHSEVEAILAEVERSIHNDVIEVMAYNGEETVNYARKRAAADSWNDQSGNLRSSIGSKTSVNGVEVSENGFEVVIDGAEGAAEGKVYVDEVLSQYKGNDYALVVVAGMEYAGYVEAIEGKDVLASAELKAREGWQKDLARLEKKQYFKG